MSIIKILSDHLINQIAAGEVVERPSSVVKELVENSLDAMAKAIVVEVKDGGKTLIRVSDDGYGMAREDAEKALMRHATSKIAEEKDLWAIRTMGFRGEALASIASVSQMVLKTMKRGDVAGTEIVCNGGEVKTIQDCGVRPGTSVEIHNLFFNTPARGNYLKKDSTELTHIISFLNGIALARPDVGFKFIHNGSVQFDLAGNVGGGSGLERRIADIFGMAVSEAMIPVFYGGSEFKLSGFVGKPAISRSDSRHQYIFVNGRQIQHYLIAYKIKGAFHSMLMENKKPVFVLNIEIDPSLIDVNVHPRKLEIRFEDESFILKTVYKAVKASLEKSDLTPLYSESERYMSDKFPGRGSGGGGAGGDAGVGAVEGAMRFAESFGDGVPGGFMGVREQRVLGLDDDGAGASLRAVTQVSNSYIVAQNDAGLVLVDQHAAHERVRYFELLKQFDSGDSAEQKNIQPLLMPQELDLTLDEVEILNENIEFFEGLGFEIEKGPDGILTLYAVPAVLSGEDLVGVVNGVLDDIANEKKASNLQGRRESILHYMACRSAIKFGQKLSLDEMNALLEQMDAVDQPYTCPHGRPTMIKLTFDELEKMFGRK